MIYPKLSDGTIDWCAMCKHEGSIFYDLCCECEYPENSDDPPAKYEPQPKTNADKLRAMSDEELAELFANWIQDCGCNNVPCREPCAKKLDADIFAAAPCEKNWLDWLRQEASDG